MRLKLFSSSILFLFTSILIAQSEQLEQITNDFFQANVSNGLVKYKELSEEKSQLDQLIQLYGMEQLSVAESNKAKAYYINAYNLFVIKALVEAYPANSPQEIPGFFTAKNHLLAGEKISLNAIEKEKLNPAKDPRLHFALVCGAKGCPPLANYAFTADNLDSLLNMQTKVALNDTTFLRENMSKQELGLSQIFKWYEADFKQEKKTLLEYINSFRENAISSEMSIVFYEYDWTINSVYSLEQNPDEGREKSNLQLFTPSALFQWGEYEVNFFNSLYFQNSNRNAQGEEIDLPNSQAFFNSLIQITSGIPKSSRINFGVDINITTARYGLAEETPADFFNDETAIYKKTIVSSIGPRIKYVPFKSIPRLSIQSTFLFPVAKNQETPFFIFHDRYTWFTQLFFDQNLGEHFQLFLEADLLYRFNRNSTNEEDFFRVPLSGFLSYFPTSKSTIYAFSQYSPRFENVINNEMSEFGLSQWFTQLGIGGKYQISPKLGIELSYADFILSNNDGAGYAINFGLRYIYR